MNILLNKGEYECDNKRNLLVGMEMKILYF